MTCRYYRYKIILVLGYMRTTRYREGVEMNDLLYYYYTIFERFFETISSSRYTRNDWMRVILYDKNVLRYKCVCIFEKISLALRASPQSPALSMFYLFISSRNPDRGSYTVSRIAFSISTYFHTKKNIQHR